MISLCILLMNYLMILEIYLFVFPRSFENPLPNYIYEYSYYAVTM